MDSNLDVLPDELLIQVFRHLTEVGSVWDEDDPLRLSRLPYRAPDLEVLPSTGLRGYPFLAQVCKKWRRLLSTPATQLVWQHVTLDLGHELVTAIHAPLRWSNQQPSPAEFQTAFQETSLSATKVIGFIDSVRQHVRALTVANTEGYDGEENEHLSLAERHDFGPSQLGFMLSLLRLNLTELRLYACHDLVTADGGWWTLTTLLPNLRVLAVEGLRGPVAAAQVAVLGQLRQLESLTMTGHEYRGGWTVGVDVLPPSWSALQGLSRLELRGMSQLAALPVWLRDLPYLRALDLSACAAINLELLPQLTQLHVLVLQRLGMAQALPSPAEQAAALADGVQPVTRCLPDLTPLAASLRTLSLSVNRFTRLPDFLPRLTRLEHLDLSFNKELQLLRPLTALGALPHLALLDFRAVCVRKEESCWSEDKCTTMGHLVRLGKQLKRRSPAPRLLVDAVP